MKKLALIAIPLLLLTQMGVVFSLPGGTNLAYDFTTTGWQSQVVMRVGGCVLQPDPNLLTIECDDARAVGTLADLEAPDSGHTAFSADARVSAKYEGVDWSTDCRAVYDGVDVVGTDVTISIVGGP